MSKKIYLIVAVSFALALVLFGFYKPKQAAKNIAKEYENISNYIQKFNQEVAALDLSPLSDSINTAVFKKFLGPKNHHLFISESGEWKYWSTIYINPNIPSDECTDFKRLIYSPTGFDYIVLRTIGDKKCYFIAHLKNSIDQRDGTADFLPAAPYDRWVLSDIAEQEGIKLFDENNTFLFSAIAEQYQLHKLLWVDILLLFLFAIALYKGVLANCSAGFSLLISAAASLLLYRLLKGFKLAFAGMHEYKPFTAAIYAHSAWLPSIGDLFINSIFLFLISLIVIYKVWPRFQNLSVNVVMLANCVVFIYLSSLFQDSQISFNFNQLSSIDVNSILGLIIILLWFITLHQLNRRLFSGANISFINVFFSLLFVGVILWLSGNGFDIYKLLGLLFFLIYYALHLAGNKVGSHFLVGILAFSIFFTYVNYMEAVDKEKDIRRLFLKKEIFDNKTDVEKQLAKVEATIADDTFLLKNDYKSNFDFGNMNKRLSQLYFANINKDYEVKLFSFTENGENIYNPNDPIDVTFLNSLYDNLPFDEELNYFKEINNQSIPIDYIAKYDKCLDENLKVYGTVYILLNHKSFAIQESYSSNIISWQNVNSTTSYPYAYAIYNEEGNIRKRKGQINYTAKLNPEYNDFNDTFVKENKVSHYLWKDPFYNQTVLVSLKTKTWDDIYTNFSFLIILLLVIIILILALVYSVKYFVNLFGDKKTVVIVKQYFDFWIPTLQFNKLFLSRRIVISFTIIVLVGFLITLFFVIRYIQKNEDDRFKEQHYAKVEETINRLNGKSFSDILIENNRNGLLLSIANELHIDISLFGANGEMYATTSSLIKEGSLVVPLLPYPILAKVKESTIGIEEADLKMGEKTYSEYYYSIKDDNNRLTGVIAIPYFSGIYYNRAGDIIKTLVNLYAILLLLGVGLVLIVARGITRPLNLLSQRLAALKLGGVFKPIAWTGDDEIAQLVRQYNQTVQQLEISTKKLAEKERQGAWKEMAQQVAHEIKNPLTPMKLNLQHLQITLRSEDQEKTDKNNKIINVLLAQIDKLTKLADDFSSFAKITDTNPEPVNIKEMIEAMVLLYNKEEKITIHNKILGKEHKVYIDKLGLERVMNNVFKNAIQAIEESGSIEITAKTKEGQIVIAIKDSGKGIDASLHDKIFSPNFSTKSSGMGIGLAMSKRIIEHAKGQIYFESKPGKGTTFFIQLPLSS